MTKSSQGARFASAGLIWLAIVGHSQEREAPSLVRQLDGPIHEFREHATLRLIDFCRHNPRLSRAVEWELYGPRTSYETQMRIVRILRNTPCRMCGGKGTLKPNYQFPTYWITCYTCSGTGHDWKWRPPWRYPEISPGEYDKG